MKYTIILIIIILGACVSVQQSRNREIPWLHSPISDDLEDIAYAASNNAKLCKELIKRIDAGTITIADIRTFIFIDMHAWSEHAKKVENQLDAYEDE